MSSVNESTEPIINIAGSIHEFGILIVIAALMIVVFMIIMTVFIRNTNNSTQSTIDQNNQFVQQLIAQNNDLIEKLSELTETNKELVTYTAEPYDKKNLVDIFLELNHVLKGTCKNAQETLKAGRVAVYVFHNGAVSSHGLPFFKLSCVSEWINRGSGFNVKIHEETNLPLTIFSSVVEEVRKHNSVIINQQSLAKSTEPVFYSWMASNNIGTCFIQGIYSSIDNTPMGYVSIEYSEEITDVEDILPMLRVELKQACIKCAPVLEFSNFQNYKYNN